MSVTIRSTTQIPRLMVEGIDRARLRAADALRHPLRRQTASTHAINRAFQQQRPLTETQVIDVLSTSFDRFDGADRGGRTDGKAGRSAFQAVVDNPTSYAPVEVAAARHLMDNPDTYLRLDVGDRGSSPIHFADGTISRADVDSVVARNELWAQRSGDATAVTLTAETYQIPEGVDPRMGVDATPEQAAAFLRHLEASASSGDPSAGAFAQILADRKDDAAWLQKFFTAMGSERTAELLGTSLSPTTYSRGQERFATENLEVVQGALSTLYEAGALNSADTDRLVEHWALERGDFSPTIADAFATLPARSEGLKTLFFDSAVSLATDGTVARLSDGDRQSLAAAASHVLAGSSTDNQVIRLLELRDAGLLDRFVELAMDHDTTVLSLGGMASEHEYTPFTSFADDPNNPRILRYDGFARLLMSVAQARATHSNRGAASPYFAQPFSERDLSALRVDLFAPAANGLEANARYWQENTTLQDSLARIFMSEFDGLIEANLIQENGVFRDDNRFLEATSNFFRYAIFTEPPSHLRDHVIQFFSEEAKQWRNEIVDLVEAGTPEDAARAKVLAMGLGQLMASSVNGLDAAVSEAKGNRERQEAAIKFLIDLGFDVIPGASLGKGVVKELVGALDSATRTQLKNLTTEQLQDVLLEKLPGLEYSQLLDGSYGLLQDLLESMPNQDTAGALLIGYDHLVVENIRERLRAQ